MDTSAIRHVSNFGKHIWKLFLQIIHRAGAILFTGRSLTTAANGKEELGIHLKLIRLISQAIQAMFSPKGKCLARFLSRTQLLAVLR